MTNAVPCLDPETIAAYLDRRLDPAARARVEEHLADCEECRTLLSETAHLLEDAAAGQPADVVPLAPPTPTARPARRPWVWSGVAAAAALLVATPFVLRQMRPTPESALRELDRALGGKRYIEGRLSGFEYGALVSATRGASVPIDSLPVGVLAAAAKVEEETGASSSAANLAALGASQLALGRIDKAIENLEDAAQIEPKNARIQTDLSAAYLARFRTGDYPEDPAKALEAAATAVGLDPQSRAAAFNHALALEALPLRGEAFRAWETYLALDSSSGWANEARAHLEELKRPLTPPPPSPSAKLDELEAEVFPAWGRAVLASRNDEASKALRRARSLAIDLHDLDQDRFALDTIAALDAASLTPARLTSLARAHARAGDGRSAYLDGRFADADQAFEEARTLLAEGRSPYADWLLMRRSTTRYQLGDASGAARLLDQLDSTVATSAHTLQARASRMRALVAGQIGTVAAALPHYERALGALSNDASGDDAIALNFLIAEALDLLGRHSDAWRSLRVGLRDIHEIDDPRQRHARLLETAIYSLRQGRPRTALTLMSELLQSHAKPIPRIVAEARSHRARILVRLGNLPGALQELSLCNDAVQGLERLAPQPRLRSEWHLAMGEAFQVGEPSRAALEFSKALTRFEATGSRWRLAAAYLGRGRALARQGLFEAADEDYRRGIAAADDQGVALEGDDSRAPFASLSADLFTARLTLALMRNAPSETSFAIADSGNARALRYGRDRPPYNDTLPDVAGLPQRHALVLYKLLDDEVRVWRVTRAGLKTWREPVGMHAIDALVAALLRDLRAGAAESSASTSLYDVLLDRVLDDDTTHLTIVPDGSLHRVPFAALFDRDRGNYLVDNVAVAISPSASAVLRAHPSNLPAPPRRAFIVVGPTNGADVSRIGSALPFAATEARLIAARYPVATIALGRDATKAAFLRGSSENDVVHFAGHALIDQQSPQNSRLVLAAETAGETGDLTSSEIQRLAFGQTQVVVLGGCETAGGRLLPGEGAMSLARPFLAAGVPVVIASLWRVDDRAAQTQLAAFHERLSQGDAPIDAMRAAQLDMLKGTDDALRLASNWANFQVFVGTPQR